ncbi:hypothetical protein FOA43_002979 [Brettanomyces nanus]|uniref:AAA+ ATPase domain-containing protein n=1 Tax=Eeniella nana TaxID=13502 RepID=A0A875S6K3_EENNA|nr:uncharacterized protein FOA43_002979 [Brettanomyces nanus]QPG75622.1 hypothetical protein FOA43_002979 [Brettanomyces nanus]
MPVKTPRKQLKVSFKVDPNLMSHVLRHQPKSATVLFFKEISDRFELLEHDPSRKRIKKHMALPKLNCHFFLLQDETDKRQLSQLYNRETLKSLMKKPESRDYEHVIFSFQDHISFFRDYERSRTNIKEERYKQFYYLDEEDVVIKRSEGPLARFSGIKTVKKYKEDKRSQWCDLFEPKTHRDILQRRRIREQMDKWIIEAFEKLKKVDKVKKMGILSKKRHKKIRYTDHDDLDDFIVDDEYDEVVEKAISGKFIPSLIISGPAGCGKTSSVYAIVKGELGGEVFEFNSSQPRGKKDINFYLKQMGTTQTVNRGIAMSRDQTAILFDDVDLIDDEDADKEFWNGVTDLLSYTYRPVIFTTNELNKIPENIVDQSTILNFENPSRDVLTRYLNRVAACRGFRFTDHVLRQMERGGLRGSLMQLQMLSYRFEMLEVGTVIVEAEKDVVKEKPLAQLDLEYDLRWCGLNEMSHDQKSSDRASPYQLSRDSKWCKEYSEITLDFYSSKLFDSGSRNRKARYSSGDDYLTLNIGSSFERLSNRIFATELSPFIRSMAQQEASRIKSGLNLTERRFEMEPSEKLEVLT